MASTPSTDQKYIVVIPDGMADEPLPELQNRTPLEAANTPHMDQLARSGRVGLARTVPQGMAPGSDVACMSLFGYDPKVYHTGRASLEAASHGIMLDDDDVVFRCNFVTITDGCMADYSAGHITTDESRALMASLHKQLGQEGLQFHAGVGYRNLLLARGRARDHVSCTPPHEIAGKNITTYWPEGRDAAWVQLLMRQSVDILREHPVNKARHERGLAEATMMWLWGQGTRPNLPHFRTRFGLTGRVITAVDLVRGLGMLAGLQFIQVPGATGYFDTNYKGKAEYAVTVLELHPLVIVHVESTDEAGHMGDCRKKIEAIEAVDQVVLKTLLEGLRRRRWDYRLLVVPDHPTLVQSRGHSAEPVPYLFYSSSERAHSGVTAFHERAVREVVTTLVPGHMLMEQLIHERIAAS